MTEATLGETTLLECDRCDGLWIGAEAFEGLCSSREAQAAVIHQGTPDARTVERQVRYRPCLQCGALMNRVNFARVSGTVVDVCKKHGTFLDRGELHAIVGFIRGGGLERARQRQIDDLKEQERRLRDQEARLRNARSGAGDPRVNTAGFSFGDLFSSD